jgi:SAM-dependent methyltransferase
MPYPGDLLVERVTGSLDRNWFFDSGRASVGELERTLAIAGRTLDSFESVLDFGCGCGRMLLWLEKVGATSRLHGADIDTEAIAWASEHIPYCRFTANAADPPLPYEDGAFDLVFNHSVFTHIDARRQDAWLRELHRVTRPGALLVLSVHGEWAVGDRGPDAHRQLEDDGHLFVAEMRQPAELGHPEWYASAFHAPWYVFEHWGAWFTIRAYVPKAALGLQDHVLLERVPDGEQRAPLAARPRRTDDMSHHATEEQVRAAQSRVGTGRSRLGPLSAALRTAVLRLIRPYTAHQAATDIELAKSIDRLATASEAHGRRLDELERD